MVPRIGELLCEVDSFAQTVTPLSDSLRTSGLLSIASSLRQNSDALSRHASTFTTETASALTTDLRILKSSLSEITRAYTTEGGSLSAGVESAVAVAVAISASVSVKCGRLADTTAGAIAIDGRAEREEGPAVGKRLFPNWEPITLAMKPLDGTFAANALAHGVAGLNVDGGRIPAPAGDRTEYGIDGDESAGRNRTAYSPHNADRTPYTRPEAGRWPANVLLDEEAAEALDEASGERSGPGGFCDTSRPLGGHAWNTMDHRSGNQYPGESGGASRFFYTAKASPAERGDSTHPTLKPIALTAYLAKLLLPPERDTPRRLLVPFCGAGSEIIGALRAGWDEVVGIEVSSEYAAMAEQRIHADAPLLNAVRILK